MGSPIIFSETPYGIIRAAPEFGEHTEEILQEVLGYDGDEITRLKDAQVI